MVNCRFFAWSFFFLCISFWRVFVFVFFVLVLIETNLPNPLPSSAIPALSSIAVVYIAAQIQKSHNVQKLISNLLLKHTWK